MIPNEFGVLLYEIAILFRVMGGGVECSLHQCAVRVSVHFGVIVSSLFYRSKCILACGKLLFLSWGVA